MGNFLGINLTYLKFAVNCVRSKSQHVEKKSKSEKSLFSSACTFGLYLWVRQYRIKVQRWEEHYPEYSVWGNAD